MPTKYYKTPTKHFEDLGVSMAIWANHNLRASVSAMQQVTKRIYEETSLINIEDKVNKSTKIKFCFFYSKNFFLKRL